jgi:hypothetical protein
VPLSPILLICLLDDVVLQIADGYHRTCSAYITDEDTLVPGRLLFAEGVRAAAQRRAHPGLLSDL